ncbi:MAG: universal stress protein [Pseudomonadota bacterium]
MNEIKNILAVVNPDRDTSFSALRGAALAKNFGANLTLVSVVYESGLGTGVDFELFHQVRGDGDRIEILKAARENLEKLAQTLDLPSDRVTVDSLWARPFEDGVREAIGSYKADLVCMAPRDDRSRKLSRAEWHLIHGSSVPILLVKGSTWADPAVIASSLDPTAVDRGETGIDHQILGWASQFADACGGLEIYHAMHQVPGAIGIAEDPEVYMAELEKSRRALIEELLPDDLSKAPVIHCAAVDPDRGILNFCRERPVDLMVMGVFARSRLKDFLIGSTARKLLPTLSCDVLAVPAGRA